MRNKVTESIYLNPVTNEETGQILSSLKNSATGWDNVGANLLNMCSHLIVQPLTLICNLSLSEGIFPHQSKIANVIPLYKSDDPMCFNHYKASISVMYIVQSI